MKDDGMIDFMLFGGFCFRMDKRTNRTLRLYCRVGFVTENGTILVVTLPSTVNQR